MLTLSTSIELDGDLLVDVFGQIQDIFLLGFVGLLSGGTGTTASSTSITSAATSATSAGTSSTTTSELAPLRHMNTLSVYRDSV